MGSSSSLEVCSREECSVCAREASLGEECAVCAGTALPEDECEQCAVDKEEYKVCAAMAVSGNERSQNTDDSQYASKLATTTALIQERSENITSNPPSAPNPTTPTTPSVWIPLSTLQPNGDPYLQRECKLAPEDDRFLSANEYGLSTYSMIPAPDTNTATNTSPANLPEAPRPSRNHWYSYRISPADVRPPDRHICGNGYNFNPSCGQIPRQTIRRSRCDRCIERNMTVSKPDTSRHLQRAH
jgi:hypothetical protein